MNSNLLIFSFIFFTAASACCDTLKVYKAEKLYTRLIYEQKDGSENEEAIPLVKKGKFLKEFKKVDSLHKLHFEALHTDNSNDPFFRDVNLYFIESGDFSYLLTIEKLSEAQEIKRFSIARITEINFQGVFYGQMYEATSYNKQYYDLFRTLGGEYKEQQDNQ